MEEETRLIIPLGLWVLREACRQMCRWQWRSPDNSSLTVSVNLSGRQLREPELIGQVEEILNETTSTRAPSSWRLRSRS